MSTKPADKFLTIRVAPTVHDRLVKVAERNERTMAGEVRRAIAELLEREGE